MRHRYKDFVTGQPKYTDAPFVGWTKPTGLLNTPYAIFRRRSEDLLVPRYLLAKETRAVLPPAPSTPAYGEV